MDKILFGENKNFYKGNMHCHSTLSDGKYTPSELKELYKGAGYSFLCITDHEVLYDNSYLNDENFVAITSTEYAIKEFPEQSTLKNYKMKVCHLNVYAKEAKNVNNFHYSKVADHYSEDKTAEEMLRKYGDHERVYSKEAINSIIKQANENGFFVCYNHPRWSLENYNDYSGFEGLWGVEIFNTSCEVAGLYEYNINVFDDFLRDGKKVFASSGDDNHNTFEDSFGTFVMVNADSLSYENIISGLLGGNFYTSTGPEIFRISIKDNKATIKTSEAKQISMSSAGRYSKSCIAKDGESINEAVFELRDDLGYIRFDVVDKFGKRANSQSFEV